MHLAGFERGPGFLVDTHAAPVAEEVWAFYARSVARMGPVPTLIEWDADLPAVDTLLAEATRARAIAA